MIKLLALAVIGVAAAIALGLMTLFAGVLEDEDYTIKNGGDR